MHLTARDKIHPSDVSHDILGFSPSTCTLNTISFTYSINLHITKMLTYHLIFWNNFSTYFLKNIYPASTLRIKPKLLFIWSDGYAWGIKDLSWGWDSGLSGCFVLFLLLFLSFHNKNGNYGTGLPWKTPAKQLWDIEYFSSISEKHMITHTWDITAQPLDTSVFSGSRNWHFSPE